MTIDAEYTVKRDSAEGDRIPGQGATGFQPRSLGAGRNVTEDYPWPEPGQSVAEIQLCEDHPDHTKYMDEARRNRERLTTEGRL